jgi:hypothetical protein
MIMHPSNVTIREVKKVVLEISIGDTLADAQLDWDTEVFIVLRSNAQNREMQPIKLSYSAIQRLTKDA